MFRSKRWEERTSAQLLLRLEPGSVVDGARPAHRILLCNLRKRAVSVAIENSISVKSGKRITRLAGPGLLRLPRKRQRVCFSGVADGADVRRQHLY